MLTLLLTLLHVLVCLVLIAVVLLQTGKRADLAGAFGGGGSQTAFGARGAATLLSKATTACAAVFMVTCLVLSVLAARSSGVPERSVLDEAATPGPAPADVPSAPPAGQPEPSPPDSEP